MSAHGLYGLEVAEGQEVYTKCGTSESIAFRPCERFEYYMEPCLVVGGCAPGWWYVCSQTGVTRLSCIEAAGGLLRCVGTESRSRGSARHPRGNITRLHSHRYTRAKKGKVTETNRCILLSTVGASIDLKLIWKTVTTKTQRRRQSVGIEMRP